MTQQTNTTGTMMDGLTDNSDPMINMALSNVPAIGDMQSAGTNALARCHFALASSKMIQNIVDL